jgi:hypothetical protein
MEIYKFPAFDGCAVAYFGVKMMKFELMGWEQLFNFQVLC